MRAIDGGNGIDFSGQNLKGYTLTRTFNDCDFIGAIFGGSVVDATFIGCNFSQASWSSATICNAARFIDCTDEPSHLLRTECK